MVSLPQAQQVSLHSKILRSTRSLTSFLYYETSLDGALTYDKIKEANTIDVVCATLHVNKLSV